MEMKNNLTVIVAARNEEKMIGGCLKSLADLGEVIVVDIESGDKTANVARSYGVKIINCSWKGYDYAFPRNIVLKDVKGGWLLYVDADERLTAPLRQEISSVVRNKAGNIGAYAISRKNIILGREFKHCGQRPDYVIRLFRADKFKGWRGIVHEQPEYGGQLGYLKNYMLHEKHETVSEMVEKTNSWSEIEAKLLFKAGHPPMSWWRFPRIMLSELWLRLIVQKGYLDGAEGVIYSFYQMWSKFMTYAKLWEMQSEIQKSKIKIQNEGSNL